MLKVRKKCCLICGKKVKKGEAYCLGCYEALEEDYARFVKGEKRIEEMMKIRY